MSPPTERTGPLDKDRPERFGNTTTATVPEPADIAAEAVAGWRERLAEQLAERERRRAAKRAFRADHEARRAAAHEARHAAKLAR